MRFGVPGAWNTGLGGLARSRGTVPGNAGEFGSPLHISLKNRSGFVQVKKAALNLSLRAKKSRDEALLSKRVGWLFTNPGSDKTASR